MSSKQCNSSFVAPKRFPFDTTNPTGYLVAFTIEYIVLGYEFFIAACTLGLGVGAFWFAISAAKEFQRFSPILNEKAQTNQSNELKIIFTELIDGHGVVKQLSIFHFYRSHSLRPFAPNRLIFSEWQVIFRTSFNP